MLSNSEYRKFINYFHIIVVVPLLYLLATNQFPEEYKKLVLLLALVVFVLHAYKLYENMKVEKMEGLNQTQGNINVVKIFDSEPGYSSPLLHVKVGDTVRWLNIGDLQHTVTSNEQNGFNSGIMRPGDVFEVTFTKAGTYKYFCMLHWGWHQGVVVVV